MTLNLDRPKLLVITNMKKHGSRDDHFIPQSLLRQWAFDSDKVCWAKKSNGAIEIKSESIRKIGVFYRIEHDLFFNMETRVKDDLNRYRAPFENRIKTKVESLHQTLNSNRDELRKDHNFLSSKITQGDKNFWIRFYHLCMLTNPQFQPFFEKWFRHSVVLTSGEKFAADLFRAAGSLNISPSIIKDELFVKYILSFDDVFINFLMPDEEDKHFIASDSYTPLIHFHNIQIGSRIGWIPLHPKLLLKVFYQNKGTDGKNIDFRVFFNKADSFNLEAMKYGHEVLGSLSQFDFINTHKALLLENKDEVFQTKK